MNKTALILSLTLILGGFTAYTEEPYYRDLSPDTWVATDALGRAMPDYATVGPVKEDQRRVVGIFYITWHRDGLAKMKSPYAADVSKILAAESFGASGREKPPLDRRVLPLGRTGDGIFSEQGRVRHPEGHVHARGRGGRRAGHGRDQRGSLLGRMGRRCFRSWRR